MPGEEIPFVNARLTLETERLRLTALTAEALAAWMAGDADRLRDETSVSFDTPLAAPPLFDEDLPTFYRAARRDPRALGWWAWVVSTREGGRAVGVLALCGRPMDGHAVLGYAVYPSAEGRGYATEAADALVSWALAQPGVVAVRALVPSWNQASRSVARKLGMVEVARELDREAGEVAVYQIPERVPRARPTLRLGVDVAQPRIADVGQPRIGP